MSKLPELFLVPYHDHPCDSNSRLDPPPNAQIPKTKPIDVHVPIGHGTHPKACRQEEKIKNSVRISVFIPNVCTIQDEWTHFTMFGCLNASNCLSKAISRNVDIGTPSSVNATRTLQKIRRKIVEDHKLNTTHSNTFKQKLQLLFECNNFSWIFQVSCLVNRSVCTWSNHNYYYFYVRISHLNFKGKNQMHTNWPYAYRFQWCWALHSLPFAQRDSCFFLLSFFNQFNINNSLLTYPNMYDPSIQTIVWMHLSTGFSLCL